MKQLPNFVFFQSVDIDLLHNSAFHFSKSMSITDCWVEFILIWIEELKREANSDNIDDFDPFFVMSPPYLSLDLLWPYQIQFNDLTILLINTSLTVALAGFMIDLSQKIHLQSTQMKVTRLALSFRDSER